MKDSTCISAFSNRDEAENFYAILLKAKIPAKIVFHESPFLNLPTLSGSRIIVSIADEIRARLLLYKDPT